MREDQRNYLAVGLFVVTMVAGLVLWLVLLSGRSGPGDAYHIDYDDVTGLKTGTEVLFNGYPIGFIDAIAPNPAGAERRFRVDVTVQRDWRIAEDSLAQITASSLLSGFIINITAGQAPSSLSPGERIPSAEATNLMAMVTETAKDMSAFLDDTLKPQLEGIVAGLSDTTERVNALLSEENTTRIGQVIENVDSASRRLNGVMAGLGDTRRRLDALLQSLGELVDDNQGRVGHAIADLQESLEAIARHSDAIAHNLEATSRNMNEFSRQIRDDPSIILRGRSEGEPEGTN